MSALQAGSYDYRTRKPPFEIIRLYRKKEGELPPFFSAMTRVESGILIPLLQGFRDYAIVLSSGDNCDNTY